MRIKFTTTLEESYIKIALDLIKVNEGLSSRNDVIEFLINKYLEENDTVGGTFNALNKKNE
jgi:hypothetical protein